MSPQDQIYLFQQGLKTNIATEVSMHYPKTLYECMTIAQRAELNQRTIQSRNKTYMNSPSIASRVPFYYNNNYQSNGAVPMEVSAINNETEEQQECIHTVNTSNGNSRIDTRRCFSCQQVGHISRFCPRRSSAMNQRTQSNYYSNYPKDQRRQ